MRMLSCFPLGVRYGFRDMKQIIFSVLAVLGLFSSISCDRHEWEDSAEGVKDGTKNLYPKEHGAGHGEHAEHGEHSTHGEHAEHSDHAGHNH